MSSQTFTPLPTFMYLDNKFFTDYDELLNELSILISSDCWSCFVGKNSTSYFPMVEKTYFNSYVVKDNQRDKEMTTREFLAMKQTSLMKEIRNYLSKGYKIYLYFGKDPFAISTIEYLPKQRLYIVSTTMKQKDTLLAKM